MGTTQIIFWFLALVSVLSAIGIIASKNPFYSVVSLIFEFFTLSAQFILMNAQFIAVANIIVGIGGIMVLFLWIEIWVRPEFQAVPMKNKYLKLVGIIASLTLMVVLVAALAHSEEVNIIVRPGTLIGLIGNLGKILFDKYVVPFLLSGVLFLSTLIGIVITIDKPSKIKVV